MYVFPEISRRWGASLAVLALTLFLAAPAEADPAGRIGRIAWISGPVQLQNSDAGVTEAAVLNRPLTSGDVLSTSAGGRAEVHIGSLKLRVDSGSVLEMTQIDDQRIRLRLADGSLIVRLPSRETARDFELDTRDGRFSTFDAGHYRFDFDGASTAVTAYSGTLRFDAEDSALDILAGQRAQFWNDGGTRYRLSVPADDSFANWSHARDQARISDTYARHVSPEMTGAEDLDAHGSWAETSEYGSVWYPRAVAADWAPYRSGRWVWIAPWGWNWVGDEPWGFAPFHYGRWVWHRRAWGWVPGARIARPVYAPALVAWVGTANFNIAISSGVSPTVGWFPLAPREIYVPAYRSSPGYVRQVNITHVTNITNVTNIVNHPQTVMAQTRYAHRTMPHAVTVVPADVVRHHRSVAAAAIPQHERSNFRQRELRSEAPVLAPVAPVQAPAVRAPEREGKKPSPEGLPAGRPDSGRDRQERRTAANLHDSHDARNSRNAREPQDKPMPLVANVPTVPGSGSAPVSSPATARAVPPAAPQRHIEAPRTLEPAARVERVEPGAVQRTPPTVVQEVRSPAAAAVTQTPAGVVQRGEKARPEIVQAPSASQERKQWREEENHSRRTPHEAPPAAMVRPAQPVQQPPAPRADPLPQSAREVREERREPPREMHQSAHQQAQAPREAARPPEPRAEPRKEQREERRHPARDEKPPTDSGRPQEDPRRR